MKKLLKGGVIVGASGCRKADLLIDGERIEAVGEALSCPEAEEIDVSGKLLFPGFLDAHTHFDLEVCNTVTADDFYTGGRSCAAARRPSSTLPARTRAKRSTPALPAGMRRRTGRPAATTAST